MSLEDKKRALRERTKAFASMAVRGFQRLDRQREDVRILGRQMIRAGTSVAANYREASRARSDAEFISKVELCAQEADETQLWLEILNEDCEVANSLTGPIWKEADELISIFVTMAKRTKQRTESAS
jgi:four helix bundle protein